MNERIKELLIQSEVFNKDGTVLKDVTGYELNKFAELIVKECAGFAEQKYGNWYQYHSPDDAPGITIKKHFGVED